MNTIIITTIYITIILCYVIGAVSIPTMLIQVPGSFLMAYTLAIRPGVTFSTWIPFVVSGILQSAVLVLCIHFHVQEQRRRRVRRQTMALWGGSEDGDDADTPLLFEQTVNQSVGANVTKEEPTMPRECDGDGVPVDGEEDRRRRTFMSNKSLTLRLHDTSVDTLSSSRP